MIEGSAERWERAQSIFMDAADLPAGQQRSFVDEKCGDDLQMMDEVLNLLEEDARQQPLLDGDLDSALGQMADAAFQTDHIRQLVERQIGPYRLLRVLGEGGMGIVYLAERTDIGGLVAIKLLRDAWLSPMRRERFVLEQQTLVKLNHPAIARLYDASTMDDGTPWFVMEFADGRPLTEYLSTRAAGIREDMLVFRRVCEAVRYAHSLAIVHRDLKPSNIYVTNEGEVKLLDFGIAKELTAETKGDRTIEGLRLMSRDYAAPEQFSGGEVGVFTDVYTLGVLLYEILTGSLPESAETRSNKPLAKPSSVFRKSTDARRTQLSKQQWTDLDVLCATALQVEPERRYRSVDAMVRDLTAYLEGRVLEARPAGLSYVAGKFARRNKALLAGIATVVLLFAAAGVYFTARLARARDAALAEAARTKRIQTFMFDMLGNGDAVAGPGNELKVSTLLDREAEHAASLNSDAATQIDLYQTLGTMYDRLGRYGESEKMLSQALDKAMRTTGKNSAKVAEVLVQRGVLHGDEGDLKNARQDMEQAIDLMAHAEPGQQDAAAAIQARIGMARIYVQSSDPQKAIDILTPIASNIPKQKGVSPEDVRDAVADLAVAELGAHRNELAQADGEKAIALDRQLLGETNPQTGTDILNLASVKAVMGDIPAAEHLYREGRANILAWYGPDHPDVATASTFLAKMLALQGKETEATPLLQDALRIQEKAYGPVHARVAFTLDTLGVIAMHQHDLATAEADFNRALAIEKSLFGEKNYWTAMTQSNLAMVYLKESKNALAEAMLHQSVDVLALLPPGNNLIATARGRWGSSLLALKRYPEAETQLGLAEQLLKAQRNAPVGELTIVQRDLVTLSAAVHRERQPVMHADQKVASAGAH